MEGYDSICSFWGSAFKQREQPWQRHKGKSQPGELRPTKNLMWLQVMEVWENMKSERQRGLVCEELAGWGL